MATVTLTDSPSRNLNQDVSAETIAVQLLEEVERVYKKTSALSDELMTALHFFFQSSLLPALDLVDKSCVTRLTSPSGRTVFQVTGSSGTPYTCLPTSDICLCQAYKFSVLTKGDHIMCKHVLAMKLSEAMEKCTEKVITDGELADVVKGIWD